MIRTRRVSTRMVTSCHAAADNQMLDCIIPKPVIGLSARWTCILPYRAVELKRKVVLV